MKRVMLAIGIAVQVMFVPSAGIAAPAGTEHLPDLQMLKPSDLAVETASGVRNLRFSSTVANLGNGRFELRPANPSFLSSLLGNQGTTRAYQGIYTHNAAGSWSKVREQQVGTFQFHSSHNHWHFERFARNELYTTAADGSRGTSLNRVAEKTTFCIIDTNQIDPGLAHSGPATYTSCGRDSTTGVSVGWADRYGSNLDGQAIDIRNLPDGDYWLVSTADYAGRILETNDSNNAGEVKFRLTGNTVTTLT